MHQLQFPGKYINHLTIKAENYIAQEGYSGHSYYRDRSMYKDTVAKFVVDNFLFGDGARLDKDTSFLNEGIIDSTGILELIMFLEEQFGIKIEDQELTPENLDSLNNISAFIGSKVPISPRQDHGLN